MESDPYWNIVDFQTSKMPKTAENRPRGASMNWWAARDADLESYPHIRSPRRSNP